MEIKSIVVLGNINNNINLEALLTLDNYRLTKTQGFLKLEKITASIYKSGKIQIYGIKKTEDIPVIWRKVLNIIKDIVDISKADSLPILKFMLCMEKLPYNIDLIQLQHKYKSENIEYEPEQFPGLIWNVDGGTILVFSSGSIAITGINSLEKARTSFLNIKRKIDFCLLK